ncbi:Coenzyme Q-binding protein coq10a, mitochondrial [Mortierella hygrophila]|uniref:Coenzyme Q-binding protein coq10a, mitochondrial n=1 Tax=Mortierella hygrophila TaxID=979708 RepID=A0A9P6EVQ9_9FUNG|nr:Coenzyme Q-binding protein coq10a, mitochondrial [Mortierella hygrophila]
MRTLIRTSTPCCHRNALSIRLYSSTRAQPASQWSSGTTSTLTTVTTGTSRRHFITLPKLPQLPNLLKPLSSSRHYKDRTLLKYSQQEFYDLVANVDDYYKFLPWCTYSKMSAPLPLGSGSGSESAGSEGRKKKASDALVGVVRGGSEVTVRHGELGIGFNSLQERYVSTVTCQEPWVVRAVSYDSKLFKELSTTWRFTPNVPKTSTLEATMDQEVQESQLLTRPAADDDSDKESVAAISAEGQETETEEALQQPSPPTTTTPSAIIGTPRVQEQPRHYFTAAAVFGEAALPRPRTIPSASPSKPSPSPSSPNPPTATSISIPIGAQSTSTKESPATSGQAPAQAPSPKQVILQRTASPSNLATMKPSDYPLVWVDFEIEFEFASPVHASMSSLFFDQVSKDMLAAFVKRAEVLYGKR